MSLYSDFQKNKEKQVKKSSKSLYAKFKEEQNKVKPTFNQRMTGEPVKQKDGTFKATTGVTDVISGLPFVGPFARMGNTLGQSMAYNKLDDKTREYLAKSSEVDTIFPDLKKKKSEIVFDAGEAMLDAATGGISGLYRKGAVNTLKLSPLKARNLADLKLTRNQIMKRLGIETGINTGAAYGYEVGQNVKEDKKGLQVLKPGYGTPLTAILTAVMGTKAATDLTNKITSRNIANKYSQKFNVPEVGVPSPKFMQENNRMLPLPSKTMGQTPIELPAKGILESQQKLRETTKIETPNVEDDIFKEAKKYKSAEEFVKAQGTPVYRGEGGSNVAQGKALLAEGKHFASDSKYPQGFGKVSENIIKPNVKVLDLGDSTFAEISKKLGIPERRYISPKELSTLAKEKGYDVLKYNGEYKSTGKQFTHFVDLTGDSTITKSQLEEIWNKAQTKTGKDIPNTKTIPEQPVKEKIINENIKTKPEDTTEAIKNSLPESEIPKVDSITLNEISKKSTDFINSNGIEKARRIALGIDPEPFKYASQGIHAELANYARKTGDGELLAELAKSDVSKESAQKVGIGRLKEPDNPYYIIKEINNELNKGQNIMTKMTEKSTVKKIVSQIKEKLPTIEFSTEQLSTIARKLTCD